MPTPTGTRRGVLCVALVSRATVGGGAKHRAGIEPAPFDYLDFETDGPLLDEAIGAAIEACKV